MATQVQFRRGSGANHATFTGAAGEATINTTDWTWHVHDGVTAGGFEIATRAWVGSQIIAGVADGSLTPVKFANTAQNTTLGRVAAGSGAPSWLSSVQQLQAMGAGAIGVAVVQAVDTPAVLAAQGLAGAIIFTWDKFR